jgi:hypothetical protein
MSAEKAPALLMVLAGSFPSQPYAFLALRDAADSIGVRLDLKDVDVIREAANVRLAHYFRPAIVARIQALQGDDDTVLVVRPSRLSVERAFPPDGSRLRLLGKFAGEIVEHPFKGDD